MIDPPQEVRNITISHSKPRIVALIYVAATSAVLFACGGSSESEDPTVTSATVIQATATTIGVTATSPPAPTRAAPPTPTSAPSVPTPVPPTAAPAATEPTEPAAFHTVDIAGHSITLPASLTINVFAENLGAPRFMAIDDAGVLYVTDLNGRVLRLPDADQNGAADEMIVVADDLENPNGITFHDGALYVAETSRVIRFVDSNDDGVPEAMETIVDGLAYDGGHFTRTIQFGADGLLYVSIGSSCNVCVEADPRRAAIVRFNADGSGEALFATGLRNAVGLRFQPSTGELWATNNGRDGLGDDIPPDTVNIVTQGEDFGWPRCHAGDIPDPDYAGNQGCTGVDPPALKLQAHSAPLGLTFTIDSGLGSDADGILLIAFHGSWDRTTPTGYKIVAISLANNLPVGDVTDFATGWLLPDGSVWGRPVDLIQANDGSLYVSDDSGGRIFRIHPVGE